MTPLKRRQAAAATYRPSAIELLIVAEAPPCALDRYFYFEDVNQHDWLFRYVYEGLYFEKPSREDKARHLQRLCADGVFLIDLHEGNVSSPDRATLEACTPDLITRCKAAAARRIVLVKSSVYDAAFATLHSAKLPVIDARIPFPTSGQQRKFLVGFRAAIQAAGFTPSGSGSAAPAPAPRASESAGARPLASASHRPRR